MSNNANEEETSGWQGFYDNIFLLLFLGVVVPTLVYTVWGLIEITMIPKLPIVP